VEEINFLNLDLTTVNICMLNNQTNYGINGTEDKYSYPVTWEGLMHKTSKCAKRRRKPTVQFSKSNFTYFSKC
jgi:hypothetical protein